MGTERTSDQIREEYAYAVGVQAALWGRPFPEYLHSIYEASKPERRTSTTCTSSLR